MEWLQEVCPDAIEEMPVNDTKFKGRNVTKFLLEEADDNLTMLLMDVSNLRFVCYPLKLLTVFTVLTSSLFLFIFVSAVH